MHCKQIYRLTLNADLDQEPICSLQQQFVQTIKFLQNYFVETLDILEVLVLVIEGFPSFVRARVLTVLFLLFVLLFGELVC